MMGGGIWGARFQFAAFQLVEDVPAFHALFEREHRMVGGHRVDQQQLLQHILVKQPGKVPIPPVFERFEQFVHAGMIAGPDQGQKHGHFAAVFPIRGFSALAGCDVQDELLRVVDPQLDPAQFLGISPAQFLQARPQEAQLEWKAHIEQGAHRIYPVVAL